MVHVSCLLTESGSNSYHDNAPGIFVASVCCSGHVEPCLSSVVPRHTHSCSLHIAAPALSSSSSPKQTPKQNNVTLLINIQSFHKKLLSGLFPRHESLYGKGNIVCLYIDSLGRDTGRSQLQQCQLALS